MSAEIVLIVAIPGITFGLLIFTRLPPAAVFLGALAPPEDIGGDPQIRVVVIRAEGPAFCAGHDLREMRAETGHGDASDR